MASPLVYFSSLCLVVLTNRLGAFKIVALCVKCFVVRRHFGDISCRKQLSERSPLIVDDITSGKELSREDIRECIDCLDVEWRELTESSETWKNRVDNTLANMRILETDMKTMDTR